MADQKLESEIHDSLHPSDNETSSSAIVSSEEVSSSTELLVVRSSATSFYPLILISQPQHVTEFLSQLLNHFSTNTISYGSTVNQIIHVLNHQLARFVFHVLARQQQAATNQSIILYTIGPQNTSQSFTLTINESPEATVFVTFILNLSMPQLARLLQAAPIQSYLLYTNESYEAVFSLGFIFNLLVCQYAISQSFDHNLVYTSATPDLSYITESSDRITEIEHEDVNRLQENNSGPDSASTTIPQSSHQPSPFNLEQVIVDIPDHPSNQSSSPIHRVEILGDGSEQPPNDARQPPPLSWINYLALIIVGVDDYTATSLLSIPYAINESGWCGFFIFISFFGVLTYFTCLLLPSIIGNNWNRTDYVSLGSAAWGQIGRRISIVILCLFSYATCIDSVMVDRDNWVLLFPQHPVILTVAMVTILSVIVCFITIDDFSPWLPSMGVTLTFVVIVCLLLLGISDTGFHGENQKKFNRKSMHMAFGILGYCYAGYPYMQKVYTLIRNKKAYGITLLIIYGISTAIYVAMGAIGYSMFGEKVNSMLTLNLPLDSYISVVAICCTLLHHAIIFVSNLTSLATTVEGLLPHDDNNNLTSRRIVIRFGFGMLSLLAIFITPYYGSFLSFSGSIIGVIVSLIFPAVLRIRNGGMTLTQMTFCWFAIVAGIITTGFTFISSFYLYLYEQ